MTNEIAMILHKFPNLDNRHLRITSPPTPKYNCIAFAAGDTNRWWWPAGSGYWPKEAKRIVKLPAFQMAFETLGFVNCQNPSLEDGIEKIAFFHKNAQPTHAARQLKAGVWTSKLGPWFDISHDLKGMEGGEYGEIAFLMQRRI